MANENESRQDQHRLQDIEIKERLKHIKNKLLVMSGKGGVGKSSVAAYLSVALARRGFKVGLMDVDLHGPSIPRMLGLKGKIGPGVDENKAHPVRYLPNMEVISIEALMGENKDAATIWRGPLKIGVIRQFISDIEWMDLDYMVIDSPPGTGDEPLTVAQTIPDAKALIVTTPQEVSLADVRKSINFCRQVNMKILGLVENMSGLKCPHCGEMIDIFKTRGGMLTAKKEGLNLLGTLPLEPEVVSSGDTGSMSILDNDDLLITREFNKMVDKVVELTKAGDMLVPEAKKEIPIRKKGSNDAKMLVIPVSGGKLSPHFGHCEQFAFIETKKGKIVGTQMHTPPAHEPGVLPLWIYEQGADVVIVGGMGERAQELLREKGIEVMIGAPMDSPESLANQYLSNVLVTGANVCDH
ncbi:MAG: iron-sulfur cluster carrier protein MrpORP [Desulfatiglans sp.]|jgi:Mrp family chromosome partitioning ATPase/predicted Fe-Mo cluster-binding NifX family protein|nr:iron-sulfur cluster carrier protein MrpORP [Thermodesulfobacteriota bacterium]MEE4352795.1 iron-sulfur cluster carrier protein MrpORP [Desulfatiglans sp.]